MVIWCTYISRFGVWCQEKSANPCEKSLALRSNVEVRNVECQNVKKYLICRINLIPSKHKGIPQRDHIRQG
jgi:hypothetical protein